MSRNRLEPPSVNQIRSDTHSSNQNYFFNPDIPVQKRSTSEANLATPTLPGLHQPRAKSPSLIRLHVKLGPNNTKEVKCSLDDDPEVLAENFCAENGLRPDLVPVVTRMLQDQFTQISQRRSPGVSPGRTQEERSRKSRNSPKDDTYESSRGRRSGEKQKNSERGNGSGGKSESEIIRIIDKPKLILKLNVNVGNNQSKQLLLFEDQDPAEVAYWFCNENNLSLSLVEVLAKQMFQAKEQYQRKKEVSASNRKNSLPRQYFQKKRNPLDQSDINSDVATHGTRNRGRDPTPVGTQRSQVATGQNELRSYEDFSVYSDKANPGSCAKNIEPTPPASLTSLQPQGGGQNEYNNNHPRFSPIGTRKPTPPASLNSIKQQKSQPEKSEHSDNNSIGSKQRGRLHIFDDQRDYYKNQNEKVQNVRFQEPTPGGSMNSTQQFLQPHPSPYEKYEQSDKYSQQSSKKVIRDPTPADSVNFLQPFPSQPEHIDKMSVHSSSRSKDKSPSRTNIEKGGVPSRTEFDATRGGNSKVPSKNNLRDEEIYDDKRSRSSHREVSPERVLDNMIPSKYILKNQDDHRATTARYSPENHQEERGRRDSNKVEAYEKWAQVISEKRKVQQKKPGASLSPVRSTKYYNNEPVRARSKSPIKIYNSAETNMAFVKSLRSDDKLPKEPIYSEIRPSRERLESFERKKMKAAESAHLVNRLHGDAKTKSAFYQELDSFSRGTRPLADSSTFNLRTSVSKSPKEIFKQQFVEGYVPGPRKRKEIERYEQYVKENFTFKPTISETSRILAEKRDRSYSPSPIHDKLHAEAVINRSNRNLLTKIGFEENHPFQPNVGVQRKKSPSPQNTYNGLSVETDFLERMTQREKTKLKKLKDELREKKEKETHTPRDPVTGQKLFKPLINKNKYYQMLRDQDAERKRKQKEERSKVFNSEVLKDADKALQGSKTLRRIFDMLDDDNDGFISEKHIQLSELDAKTLEALINIFDIIEEKKLKLNFLNFCRLVESQLTVEEKEMLELDVARDEAETARKNLEKSFRKDEISYLSKYGIKSLNQTKTPSPERRVVTAPDYEKVTSSNLTRHYQKLINKR